MSYSLAFDFYLCEVCNFFTIWSLFVRRSEVVVPYFPVKPINSKFYGPFNRFFSIPSQIFAITIALFFFRMLPYLFIGDFLRNLGPGST